MSRHPRARRTPKGPLFAALALLLVSGLLSASPLAAHTFTKKDGDDSPSRLDIRSSSVEHSGRTIVHTVRTYEGWTPKSLGKDSFFVVEIDKDSITISSSAPSSSPPAGSCAAPSPTAVRRSSDR